MATATQLIDRALRKIGALAAGETAGSDMSTDALADLNAMLARWLDVGIEISNGEVILTDVIPQDIGDEEAVVFNLAELLLPEYPSPNGAYIMRKADETYRRILAKYDDPGELQTDDGLLQDRRYGYNINNG